METKERTLFLGCNMKIKRLGEIKNYWKMLLVIIKVYLDIRSRMIFDG
jgi:hypothetical protein